MEDILRWGTQDLFQARKDSEDSLAAEQSGELDGSGLAPVEGGVASTRDSTGNGEAFKQAKVTPPPFVAHILAYTHRLYHSCIQKQHPAGQISKSLLAFWPQSKSDV